MPLLKESTYTIDDIYALPDGERAELIDGHIYYMAPPSRVHQRIQHDLPVLLIVTLKIIMVSVKFTQPHSLCIWTKQAALM